MKMLCYQQDKVVLVLAGELQSFRDSTGKFALCRHVRKSYPVSFCIYTAGEGFPMS
jgi:hypothetical protein